MASVNELNVTPLSIAKQLLIDYSIRSVFTRTLSYLLIRINYDEVDPFNLRIRNVYRSSIAPYHVKPLPITPLLEPRPPQTTQAT